MAVKAGANPYNGMLHLKFPKNISEMTLMKGVTDFSNLKMFDMYETGYSFLVVLGIPTFMASLAGKNDHFKTLQNSVIHVMENEFRGISGGIPDITTDPGTISNGNNELQLIQNVTIDTSTTFDMNFWERSGSLLTKYAEIYLTGIKDPYSKAKTYHGLIEDGVLNGEPMNEVFTFLYYVTDNTMRNVEKACLFANAQLSQASLGQLYAFEKGSISFQEVTYSFTAFPIFGDKVNQYAARMLDNDLSVVKTDKRKIILDSTTYDWNIYNDIAKNDTGIEETTKILDAKYKIKTS